jgi:LacI family transcriptional regulator, gluconate utilization system Gnt-I transcriptional repressor
MTAGSRGRDLWRRSLAKTRIDDVARKVGVSTSTVSRALRSPGKVAQQTRERIEAAVDELGFVPSFAAGILANARSRAVGVIVPSIINAFFAVTLEALTEALEAEGYQVMIGRSDYSIEREERLVASFVGWSPAGIVLTGTDHSPRTRRLVAQAGVPVVEMWELGDSPMDLMVGFSHPDVGAAVARHFAEAGARRLAFVGAALDLDRRALQRGEGFRREASARGLEIVSIDVPERSAVAVGAQCLAQLMTHDTPPDAVFLQNDVLALGALLEASRRGIEVPRDIKLCGFGDLDYAGLTMPGLTTVRPPGAAIGRTVAEALLARIAGEVWPSSVMDLGFTFVARDSG